MQEKKLEVNFSLKGREKVPARPVTFLSSIALIDVMVKKSIR